MLDRSNRTVKKACKARRHWWPLFNAVPSVVIAPDAEAPEPKAPKARSTTRGARWARDYRKRQANTMNTGKRKIENPIGIIPLPLEKLMIDILAGDPGFKPPPPGATQHQFRQAIGELASRILKKGLVK